jgi:L-aminopeptidase/D-esterase-like protein
VSQSHLIPRITFDGPALEFDFPAMRIGTAEYDEGPTGATVFWFPRGIKATVDVRGGAPGTLNTDGLRLSYESHFVHAICFAGGSSYGLSAATGAANQIKEQTERSSEWQNIAVVAGAIIFDLGGRRFNTITPDDALGRAAMLAAQPNRFWLGPRGAGRFAMQGAWFGNRQHSGQGAAFRESGPTKVGVFTVVNAGGTVVDRNGDVVRCSNDPAQMCLPVADYLKQVLEARTRPVTDPRTNTTNTLVVTNQRMDFWSLQRLAVQVHASMGRAIQPFHTSHDGDVLFAATTDEITNPAMAGVDLAVFASEVAWDAVLASVPPLPTFRRDRVSLSTEQLGRYPGRYDFGHDTYLVISRDNNRLFAEATGRQEVYGFPLNERIELVPTSEAAFYARNARLDVLRFADNGGTLELNPEPWVLQARRVS